MKVALICFIVSVALLATVNAVTEPVCSYQTSQGETVFLKYLPLLRHGEDYVDFSNDGKCVKRATCTDTFQTVVEDCKKYSVTCANKKNYQGVFPACCAKC